MMLPFRKIAIAIVVLFSLSGLLPDSFATAQTDGNPFSNLEEISLENSSQLKQLASLDDVKSGYSLSPEDMSVAIAYPDGVRIYSLEQLDIANLFFSIDDALEVYAPVFSPDGKRLSVTYIPKDEMYSITQVWNVETGEIFKTFRTGYFSLDTDGAQFSPNGRYLMGQDRAYFPGEDEDQQPNEANGALYVWDTVTDETLCEPNECAPRYGIAGFTFTPDSRNVIWGVPDGVVGSTFETYWRILPLTTENATGTMNLLMPYYKERTGPLSGEAGYLIFSPQGNTLASMGSVYKQEKSTLLWNVQSGKEVKTLGNDINFIQFIDDQLVLVSDSVQENVSLLNIDTDETAVLFQGVPDQNWSVSIGDAKKIVVTWENNSRLIFWGIPNI